METKFVVNCHGNKRLCVFGLKNDLISLFCAFQIKAAGYFKRLFLQPRTSFLTTVADVPLPPATALLSKSMLLVSLMKAADRSPAPAEVSSAFS